MGAKGISWRGLERAHLLRSPLLDTLRDQHIATFHKFLVGEYDASESRRLALLEMGKKREKAGDHRAEQNIDCRYSRA